MALHGRANDTRAAGGGEQGAAAVAAARRGGGDYVPREQHEALELEAAAVKEQLIECLEELSARERELSEVRLVGAQCAGAGDRARALARYSNASVSRPAGTDSAH
jgi:hypothetical protein